jgi:hypothetical protein
MSVLFKFGLAACVSTTLVACGGNSGSSNAELLARTNGYQAVFDRVDRTFASGQATVDRMSGTGSYSGAGVVAVNPDFSFQSGDAILLGDAQIDVNFNNGNVDGTITNLFGIGSGSEIDEYSGQITISGGNIGAGSHNDVSADYAGTIRGNGDVITFDGEMDGTLLGNPSVTAIDMAGVDNAQLNGSTAVALVGLTVERD